MLVNIILILLFVSGMATFNFFIGYLFKQYKSAWNMDIVELFPKEDMYAENAYEDERFKLTDADKVTSERWAAMQRGSFRIANGAYFTSSEYEKYRERVLNTELPWKSDINDTWGMSFLQFICSKLI